MSQQVRFLIRSALAGIATANASLLTALYAGEPIDGRTIAILASLGVGSALAFAGISAAIPQVDGSIGNKIAPPQQAAEAAEAIKTVISDAETATSVIASAADDFVEPK